MHLITQQYHNEELAGPLLSNDIRIISKKLHLSISATRTLLQDQSDVILTLRQIYPSFTLSCIKKLSFFPKFCILFFKEIEQYKLDDCTILYMLRATLQQLNTLQHIAHPQLVITYDNEQVAHRNIVLCGCFGVECCTVHWGSILMSLKKTQLTDLGKNINNWINTLKKISPLLFGVNTIDAKHTTKKK